MRRAAVTVTPEQARTATNLHYEQAPEYFAAFLDERLKYSSALYADSSMSLEDAQTAKLRFVAGRLGVTGGGRLLDIGCGWGSLTLFMAEEYGVEVTGVTPSGPQAEHVRARAEERGVANLVDVRVGSFTSTDIGGRYDFAAMLGSIVHMPDRRAALAKTYAALRRGGRLYLSESCFRNEARYAEFNERPGTRHVTESIFGFADLVPLSTLVAAAEDAGFSLVGLADLTAHYRRTIEEWERRAVANRDRIEEVAPGRFDALVRYLRTANAGWGYTTKHYALTAERSRLGPEVPPA
jgi:cyclopropane-fatty-acyl-phospholipid synthase